jgi:decaprenylphospho-beta-D-erythro-pentofuranosid-2-ulose 2-reductase
MAAAARPIAPGGTPRVLMLGATSPIARALALEYARGGASLYLAARDTAEAARIAQDLAVRTGAAVHAGPFEAADYAAHPELIARAAAAMGGLDGVALCFGALGDEPAAHHDAPAAIKIITDNYTGAVSILTIAADYFAAQQSGFIIVIGSVAGERGRSRNYIYGSAKGALALFAQGMRARFARTPIHVMTVILGTVDTRMTWGREGAFLTVAPERAAAMIHKAWRRRAEVAYVPFFWRFIMGVIKALPERIFKKLKF